MGQGEASPTGGVLAPSMIQTPASDDVKWHLAEVRIEGSSISAVEFSEPCTLCGRKKRRALQPPTRERKKVLVLEQEEVCGYGSSGGGRCDIGGSVIEDKDLRGTEPSSVGKTNPGVATSPLSEKEVVGVAHPSAPVEMEKGKKTDAAATKEDMDAPVGNKKQEASTRDERTEKVTVRVNETGSVVLTGGKLQQVKLCATCKCQTFYEIVL